MYIYYKHVRMTIVIDGGIIRFQELLRFMYFSRYKTERVRETYYTPCHEKQINR
jgi:hypothetical protein